MTGEVKPAWLKRSFVWVLLPLWVAFAVSWAIISARYSVHLGLLPVPQAGSISMNVVALLLYVPPALLLFVALGALRRDGPVSRALHVLGWALVALLIVALAIAAFNVIQIATD